jgi:hypothetical protein
MGRNRTSVPGNPLWLFKSNTSRTPYDETIKKRHHVGSSLEIAEKWVLNRRSLELMMGI